MCDSYSSFFFCTNLLVKLQVYIHVLMKLYIVQGNAQNLTTGTHVLLGNYSSRKTTKHL